tara:strand:+ start:1422 stop:1604 length:183 start_codon:yes stop_codon:yes gene_type:complete
MDAHNNAVFVLATIAAFVLTTLVIGVTLVSDPAWWHIPAILTTFFGIFFTVCCGFMVEGD